MGHIRIKIYLNKITVQCPGQKFFCFAEIVCMAVVYRKHVQEKPKTVE